MPKPATTPAIPSISSQHSPTNRHPKPTPPISSQHQTYKPRSCASSTLARLTPPRPKSTFHQRTQHSPVSANTPSNQLTTSPSAIKEVSSISSDGSATQFLSKSSIKFPFLHFAFIILIFSCQGGLGNQSRTSSCALLSSPSKGKECYKRPLQESLAEFRNNLSPFSPLDSK